ncbi:hypothetical protein GCM10027589_30410 [Actinocorallia lasiicapitis]
MHPAAQTREDLPVLRPRMNPAKRRALELGALALLAVVLIEVRWWDDVRQVQQTIDRPERVTAVTDRGDFAGASWTLTDKRVTESGVVYRLLAVPADQTAGDGLIGVRYRVRGSSLWSAAGDVWKKGAPGRPTVVTVTAGLPRERADTAVLELLVQDPGGSGPVPVLRFAR